MPRPLLLDRPSGPYVRFLVPTDLRARVGSRFLVRPLRQAQGEAARLAAALLDMALSDAFRRMRRGGVMVDINELLRDMQGCIDLTIGGVSLPNGVQLQNVYIETADDERQFRELLAASSAPVAQVEPRREPATPPSVDDLLPAHGKVHLDDVRRAERDAKTIMGSRHSLYLLEGIIGNKPVGELRLS